MKENLWKVFFDMYAPRYMNELFTRKIEEVNFIEKLFNSPKGLSILDVGCETARHAVELAKKVTLYGN